MSGPLALSQLQSRAIEYINEQQAQIPAGQLGPNSPVAHIVNEVLKRLIAVKPAHKQAFSVKGAVAEWKKSWTLAFAQHGIRTLEQIELGIKRAQLDPSPFMPSIGQFIQWCNPVELTEVEMLEAFTRMIERKKPLTDVEHAARLKCAYQCRNQLPQDKALALFASHMKALSAKQLRGEFIPSRDTKLLECKGEPRKFNQKFEQQITQRVPRTAPEIRMLKIQLKAKRRAAFEQRKANSRLRQVMNHG
ncbi:replication protein P [Shewanella putrefaciens]|uniref:replication protein P n=1 Tax=Shewanella putrefaciens TaxID=24 RepID=UPI003D79344E